MKKTPFFLLLISTCFSALSATYEGDEPFPEYARAIKSINALNQAVKSFDKEHIDAHEQLFKRVNYEVSEKTNYDSMCGFSYHPTDKFSDEALVILRALDLVDEKDTIRESTKQAIIDLKLIVLPD
jgi:hypothetical protein